MSEIACQIWKTFAENNIEIPYPQRDLHIRTDIALRTREQGTENREQ